MDTQTYLTLGFTFLVGCFSGAYLYITVFSPQYVGDGFEDPSEITLRIQGQAYGGCDRAGSCPSFQLENNRKYTYKAPASYYDDAEALVVTGKMDRSSFKDLTNMLVDTNFAILQQRSDRNCESYVDGIDYHYEIILQGEQYGLDTCGTAFNGSALERSLRPLWETFATTSDDLPYILERGMTGAAYDAIDGWFQYDEKRAAQN